MAEETLVKEALTDQMIEAGASVVDSLAKRGFAVDAALWLYLPDLNRWRLYLAMPEVRAKGPKKAYQRVLRSLRDIPGMALDDVSVVDSDDPFIRMFRGALRADRSPNGVRLSRGAINGQFVEDAYVYRTAA